MYSDISKQSLLTFGSTQFSITYQVVPYHKRHLFITVNKFIEYNIIIRTPVNKHVDHFYTYQIYVSIERDFQSQIWKVNKAWDQCVAYQMTYKRKWISVKIGPSMASWNIGQYYPRACGKRGYFVKLFKYIASL